MSIYSLLADLVAVVHFGFVLFVVLGLILILTGAVRGWSWIRYRMFRMAHLLAIGVVVAQVWLGVLCPLTSLENWLRVQGGGTPYPDSFISYWIHQLMFFEFPNWVFVSGYTLFGLAVLATFVVAPPRFKRSVEKSS